MIKMFGKNGISAAIIADSISPAGIRMTTFELEFHRYILAEHNTHRMLSKNAASSRAIPVETMLRHIVDQPAIPVHWGLNNPGMQSNTEMSEEQQIVAKKVWLSAMEAAVEHARMISAKDGINAHKQIANRLTECFAMSKVVLSGTNFDNLFHLRRHKDAQPEFRNLTDVMYEVMQQSVPNKLQPGKWHLPYIDYSNGKYYASGAEVSLDIAKKVSASCCAQVSYRKLNDSVDKAISLFDMLHLDDDSGEPAHASPVEHQATPMDGENIPFNPNTWEHGVTHVRRDGSLWSGNLRGWIQYRQLIENEAVW